MADKIIANFLGAQYEEATALAQDSPVLELIPFDEPPHQVYVARFHCKGLVKHPDGQVQAVHRHWDIGIRFPDDYLRRAESAEVITFLDPPNAFHPNIKPPFVCMGRIAPGTSLTFILHQLFDILTYNKVTMREDDALNHDACQYAREHVADFPLQPSYMGRRALNLTVAPSAENEEVSHD